MSKILAGTIAAVTIALLAGCTATSAEGQGTSAKPIALETATSTPTPTPTPEPVTGASVAAKIRAGVPTVTKTLQITEDNDANKLIGRPNGYTDAVVLYDSAGACDGEPGVACGATIEVWKTAKAAEARKTYIQGIYEASPALGSEYNYVKGNVILRVSGSLKPSQAAPYETVFSH